jgi:uncharacterized protein
MSLAEKKMDTRDFALMGLGALGGKVRGRTMLQKKLYFLGLLTGELDSLGYRPHYYGPYSAPVADAVTQLKVLGFVGEQKRPMGLADDAGFELTRVDYSLNDDGKLVLERKRAQNAELAERLQQAARRLESAGDISYVQLSIAAKIIYLLRSRSVPLTLEAIREAAGELGWPIDSAQYDLAVNYLKKLQLVVPADQ